jgi:hypothetical protein
MKEVTGAKGVKDWLAMESAIIWSSSPRLSWLRIGRHSGGGAAGGIREDR